MPFNIAIAPASLSRVMGACTLIKRIAVVALVSLLGYGQALADGHNLLVACKMIGQKIPTDDYSAFESGLCIGFVQGVRQTLSAYADLLPKEQRICVPRAVNNKESVGVVVKYLEAHPNQLKQPEVALAIQAHREAFPCK
ncbi:Rap1a/Tai family immunity protein [Pseudomonas fluorescens]|uniref:Rap1a/Tai family immunity protein n=1 Tax=Pseudomonas fluorescens TaxID=294 RepID=UPI0029673147|nr:Rap1a/Tai family immunity protein [Pseudomonas fluorescens]